MKNQYFGDINDYRKYGLIRSILRAGNFRLLVAWMLTPDDGSADGKFVEYLSKPKQWKNFDPTLYEGLQRLMRPGARRGVELIESTNLLPSANYYSRIVPDADLDRGQWMQGLVNGTRTADLVFLDPDNGFEVKCRRYGRKRSSKYVYWREVNDLWAAQKSLLVYQHFPMEKRLGFIRRMLSELSEHAQGAFVEAFSTPHVVFFLALQQHHQKYHAAIVNDVHKNWGSQIQHWELYSAGKETSSGLSI